MQRRSFLKHAAVGGAATTAVAAPAIVGAQPAVRWRCTSGFPKSLDTIYGAAEFVSKRLGELTNGKFQMSVHAAGELVPMPQAADAVAQGTFECSHTAAFYYVGKDPAWAFGSTIPFGLNFRQFNAWWLHGGGEAAFNEFLKPQGMFNIIAGNTGAQMGGWFRKEINGPDDMKGLKFRIPSLGGRIMERIGAVPQQIPGGDIYPALEKGTIDAAEWVGPYDDEKLGFNKVAKFYYYPGFWEGGASLGFLVNQKAFEALPKEYQAALVTAAHESNAWMMAKYDAQNPAALRRLVAAGVQLRAFPRPVMEAAYRGAQEVYKELSATNPQFKRLYDQYLTFQREQVGWFRVTENTFDDFMANVKRQA